MILKYINRPGSKINIEFENFSTIQALMLADMYVSNAISSLYILRYLRLNNFSYDSLIELYAECFRNEKETPQIIAKAKEFNSLYKREKKVKYKNQAYLVYLGRLRIYFDQMRISLKEAYEKLLKEILVYPVLPYRDSKVFVPQFSYVKDKEGNDQGYIDEIATDFILNDVTLVLNNYITTFMTKELSPSSVPGQFIAIEIALWDFPHFTNVSYEEINSIREELKPKLLPFKNDFYELTQQLREIKFEPENISQIKELANAKIAPHIEPIKEFFDENLYMCKMRKSFFENSGITLYLGIASVEDIVNYFEWILIVKPYMASAIKEQVARHVDIRTCIPFIFFKLNMNYPNLESCKGLYEE